MRDFSQKSKDRINGIKSKYEKSLVTAFSSRLIPFYDRIESSLSESAVFKLFKTFLLKIGFIVTFIRRFFTKAIEQSRIIGFAEKISDWALEKSLRYYGVALFFFGFFHLALMLVDEMNRFGDVGILTYDNFLKILPGILTVTVAAVMMISQKNLASQILSSKLVSFLLFDIFSFDKKYFEKIKPADCSHTLPVIIGMIFGIASIIVSPVSILLFLGSAFMIALVLKRPENGIIGICLSFPFVNNNILTVLLIVVSVSYFIKVLRQKRIFKIGLLDIFLLLLTAVLVFCAFKSFDTIGSRTRIVEIILCMLFGFILSNTMRTSRLVAKCINSLLVSASISAFFVILSFVSSRYDLKSLNGFTKIIFNYPAAFPFDTNGTIFEILVLFIPLTLAKRHQKGISAGTYGYLSFFLVLGAALVSFDTSVWFTVLAAILIYISIVRPFLAFPIFVSSVFLLTLAGVFPGAVSSVSEFLGNTLGVGFDFDSVAYSNSVAINLFENSSYFGGFGIGNGAVQNAIAYYFGSGFSAAAENMTFIIKAAVENGIFGVFVLFFAYAVFFIYSFGIYFDKKVVSAYNPYVAASLAAVSTVAVKGFVFPMSASMQSILVICVYIYICTSVKQSALIEYVPKDAELSTGY